MLDPGSGRGDEKIKREIALMAALAEVEWRRIKNSRSGKLSRGYSFENTTIRHSLAGTVTPTVP